MSFWFQKIKNIKVLQHFRNCAKLSRRFQGSGVCTLNSDSNHNNGFASYFHPDACPGVPSDASSGAAINGFNDQRTSITHWRGTNCIRAFCSYEIRCFCRIPKNFEEENNRQQLKSEVDILWECHLYLLWSVFRKICLIWIIRINAAHRNIFCEIKPDFLTFFFK